MISTRYLYLLMILVFLSSSCTKTQTISTVPTVTPISTKTPTITVIPTSPEPVAEPLCFTPRELLPFTFSPDSSDLLIRSAQGVQVIDLESGQEKDFISSTGMVVTAALSPNAEILAWSLDNNTIQLIRMLDRQVLHTIIGHPDIVYDLRFSPDGAALYSVSHDGWVRGWDPLRGSELSATYAGREILGIGLSPDGKQFATVPGDGPVQLWDIAKSEVVMEFGSTGGYDTSEAVFSPDGKYLAADLATGLFLWRVSGAELIWDEVKNSMAIAYSPDGAYLAYSDVDVDNQITLASPDGSHKILTLSGMQGPVWELFFSPDSALLAANDGIEIRIWQVPDGELLYIGKSTCP